MKNIFLFIIFIILIFFFILFTNKGNELLKPQIQNYLQAQMENNETIEVEKFNLSLGELSTLVVYNKNTKLQLNGDYSSLFKSFDMKYHLVSDNFKYKKVSIEEHLDINGTIVGDISDKTLHFKGDAHSEMGDLNFEESSYHLKNKTLESDYLLYLNDLSKLKKYTKQQLEGNITVNGHIKKEKNLLITGEIKDLDGLMTFTLKEKDLKINMDNLSAQKVMAMLRYPPIFKASMVGEVNYNLKKREGEITSQLNEVQLLPNNLTNIVKKFNGFDISKEKFDESQFNATIHSENIVFEFNAKNKTTNISLSKAYLNQNKKTINAQYNVAINGKDIGGRIEGSIYDPDISVNSSQYMREKVNSVIDKNSETLKNIGIGEKEQKQVKDFFNSLFQ